MSHGNDQGPVQIDLWAETYRCRACKLDIPVADFAPAMAKRVPGMRICRKCKRESEKIRIARNDPNHDRRRTLRIYGLSLESFEAMKAAQGGFCALCGELPLVQVSGKAALEVDHDKRTGRVRSLLCKRCNVLLAMVDDDPARLARIAAAVVLYVASEQDWRTALPPLLSSPLD